MKKGNIWPRARARWVEGANTLTMYAPPVWATAYNCLATYIKVIEGIPVPLTVSQAEMAVALWRYSPSDGANVWKGEWDNGFDSGHWYLRQWNDGYEWIRRRYTLQMPWEAGLSNLVMENPTTGEHGDWQPAFPNDIQCNEFISFDAPWVGPAVNSFTGTTYGALRTLGIDPDDTRPATWTYSDTP